MDKGVRVVELDAGIEVTVMGTPELPKVDDEGATKTVVVGEPDEGSNGQVV